MSDVQKQTYNTTSLTAFDTAALDLRASLVVFLVALPLCIGIGVASKVPIFSSLLAGMIGGLVVAPLSQSRFLVSGPAAALIVFTSQSIGLLGSFEAFCLCIFFAGCLQVSFYFLRLGRLGSLFPTSVISGMLTAIGLILVLKQIPHILGFDLTFMGSEAFFDEDNRGTNTIRDLFDSFQQLQPGALFISIVTIVTSVFWEKLCKRFSHNHPLRFMPGPLIAVLAAITVNHLILENTSWAIMAAHMVQLPETNTWLEFTKLFHQPHWEVLGHPHFLKTTITLALLCSIESLLCLEAVDRLDPKRQHTPKGRELFAQGIGNMVSGLLGGLPINAVIVRSSANLNAGAQSSTSAILHGLWLFIAIIFLPKFVGQIPLATLASILLLVGVKLINPQVFIDSYHKGKQHWIPFLVTVVAIIATDFLKGILIGLCIGFIFVFRRNMHQSVISVTDGENNFLIRFMKDISFLHKDDVTKKLYSIPKNAKVIIDGSKDVFIDDDIVQLIDDFIRFAPNANISVKLQKSSTAFCQYFRT